MHVELDNFGTRRKGGLDRRQGVLEERVLGRVDVLGRAGIVFERGAVIGLMHPAMSDEPDLRIVRRGGKPGRVEEIDTGHEGHEHEPRAQQSRRHTESSKAAGSRVIGWEWGGGRVEEGRLSLWAPHAEPSTGSGWGAKERGHAALQLRAVLRIYRGLRRARPFVLAVAALFGALTALAQAHLLG